ncbi:MAG TPA: hypothetical protein VLG49_05860 [Rhabdochlamydiaceae bacterium]|nr:hypothetical protein [Rhabdochlamydiaceae bacterium]
MSIRFDNVVWFNRSGPNVQNEIQKNATCFQNRRMEIQVNPPERKDIEELILTNIDYVKELPNHFDKNLSKLDLIDHPQINNYWLKFALPSIFPKLVFLGIYGCENVTNDPSAFLDLPQLKELRLIGTKFEEFADIRPLLERGIRVHIATEKRHSIMYLAFKLAQRGDFKALDLVLKTGSFVSEDIFEVITDPSLHATTQFLDWFKKLIHDPRFDVNVKGHSNNTMLHHFCEKGRFVFTNILLNHPKVDRGALNSFQQTPLGPLTNFFKKN